MVPDLFLCGSKSEWFKLTLGNPFKIYLKEKKCLRGIFLISIPQCTDTIISNINT